MVKRIVILMVLLPAALLLPLVPAYAAAPLDDIVAASALLAEADSGTILFQHDMTRQHPADGLAKIMTLLLAVSAIQNAEVLPGELIEMTESAWFDIDDKNTTQKIKPGEEMRLIDLMYCAYVGGADEACNMIAERIDGSVEAFVERMNVQAAQLGCDGTNFINTHGKYSDSQYTTARDQYFIFRDAMGKELFAEIAGTYRHTVEATNMSDARTMTSPNSLLNLNGKYYFRHCTGGMTSGTYEGGHSFVSFAEADGLSLISVVLGSDIIILEDESTEMRHLTESRRLFEWGFSGFSWRTILAKSDLVDKAPIMHGAGADFVNLCPQSEIRLLLDNDIKDEEFIRVVTIYSLEDGEDLIAPISAGKVLGEVTVTRYDPDTNVTTIYGTALLVANTSVELHKMEFVRIQVIAVLSSSTARTIMAALTVLIVLYLALVIRYNLIRRKRLKRIAEAKRRLIEERQAPGSEDA